MPRRSTANTDNLSSIPEWKNQIRKEPLQSSLTQVKQNIEDLQMSITYTPPRTHFTERTKRNFSRVSIFDPLDSQAAYNTGDSNFTRPLPAWMSLLPSNHKTIPRVVHEIDSSTRLESYRPLLAQSSEDINKLSTSQLNVGDNQEARPVQRHHNLHAVNDIPVHASSKGNPPRGINDLDLAEIEHLKAISPMSKTTVASSSYFQSPKTTLSTDVEPFCEISKAVQKFGSANEQPHDFNDILNSLSGDATPHGAICPICEETLILEHPEDKKVVSKSDKNTSTTSPFVLTRAPTDLLPPGVLAPPSVDHLYHTFCIRCRACRLKFDAKHEDISSWVFLGAGSPYHHVCATEGAAPMLDRLRSRIIPKNISKETLAFEKMNQKVNDSKEITDLKDKQANSVSPIAARGPTSTSSKISPRTSQRPISYGGRPRASLGSLILSLEAAASSQRNPPVQTTTNTNPMPVSNADSRISAMLPTTTNRNIQEKKEIKQVSVKAEPSQNPQEMQSVTSKTMDDGSKKKRSVPASHDFERLNRRHTRPHRREERIARLARAQQMRSRQIETVEKARSPFGWGEHEEVGIKDDKLVAPRISSQRGPSKS